jgi:hypothetical protein
MGLLKNIDLVNLAVKGELIGSTFYFADNTFKVIDDFELSMATDQICLKFADGEQAFFNFREKFKVDTVNVVARVKKGRVKLHKKEDDV